MAVYLGSNKVDISGVYTSSGGGSGVAEKKQVNFIDYDGTILYSYTAEEAQALTALPANPSHSGLVAQGWNWSLADIKSQLTNVGGDVWIGQMYTTASGDTEMEVEFQDSLRLSPTMTIAVNGTVTVDWGDHSATTTVTGSSLTTMLDVPHEYASPGKYVITIHVVSGSFTFSCTSTKTLLRKNTTTNENRVYTNCVRAVRFGSGISSIGDRAFYYCQHITTITIPREVTSIGSYAFQHCYSLKSVTIPSGVTNVPSNLTAECHSLENVTIQSGATGTFGGYAFQNCYSLTSVTIPMGITGIGAYTFAGCRSLSEIVVPEGVTFFGSYAFQGCYCLASATIPSSVVTINNNAFITCMAIASVTIPSNVTSITSYAFQNCYGVAEYHVLPTTPPTLGASAFSGMASDCVIYVPSESLSAYQTATNWSTYASYMQGE